jgi:predicted DNA binding protein
MTINTEQKINLANNETIKLLKEYFPNLESNAIKVSESYRRGNIYTVILSIVEDKSISLWTAHNDKNMVNVHMFYGGNCYITIWK